MMAAKGLGIVFIRIFFYSVSFLEDYKNITVCLKAPANKCKNISGSPVSYTGMQVFQNFSVARSHANSFYEVKSLSTFISILLKQLICVLTCIFLWWRRIYCPQDILFHIVQTCYRRQHILCTFGCCPVPETVLPSYIQRYIVKSWYQIAHLQGI